MGDGQRGEGAFGLAARVRTQEFRSRYQVTEDELFGNPPQPMRVIEYMELRLTNQVRAGCFPEVVPLPRIGAILQSVGYSAGLLHYHVIGQDTEAVAVIIPPSGAGFA